jgi:hypothetical protein
MMQVGLDMPPTRAQIDTWETDCRHYNSTIAQWKQMQSQDLTTFNALLTRNNLNALTATPGDLTTAVCTFAAPAGVKLPPVRERQL